MREWIAKRGMRLGVLALMAMTLVASGGCPIDTDTVVTETVGAALNAMVTTFLDSLGQYLAGN